MTKNKTPRINPYQRLLETFREYWRGVEYAQRKTMWRYARDSLGKNWSLVDLDQRVAAAQQIGYDVILISDDEGLLVQYRKKHPDMPWEVR
jgi:hypothetical protein